MIKSDLWSAYGKTCFQLMAACAFERFAIITAWNPRSCQVSEQENEANTVRLLQRLRPYNYVSILAGDPHFVWYERSYAVEMAVDEALVIARDFSQNAIFYVSDGVLYLHSCYDNRKSCLGRFEDRILKSLN